MKVNVLGLGYVGVVSAACLARDGHDVTGIDKDIKKMDMINQGKAPIIEPGLDELIQKVRQDGKFKTAAVNPEPSDVTIICVGTPSKSNGDLNLEYIENVARELGHYLLSLDSYHVINLRSTVLPGTTENVLLPLVEKISGKKVGQDFGVCMNPEFLREGSSIQDYYTPPFTVIGAYDDRSWEVVKKLYDNLDAPLVRTKIKEAEMIKYTCNSFHGLKVSFANEIGNICKSQGIDSHAVMDVFCMDDKLNLSPYYLKPGFAFGGSCLPKDLRALSYNAKKQDLDVPVINSIMASNQKQIDRAFDMIRETGKKKVGIIGLSFKKGTDDLRESPMVELVEKLIGKGYSISIFDKEVSLAKIFGSNKKYIETTIPHISQLLKNSLDMVLDESEVIVVGSNSLNGDNVLQNLSADKVVIDLIRINSSSESVDYNYEGICW